MYKKWNKICILSMISILGMIISYSFGINITELIGDSYESVADNPTSEDTKGVFGVHDFYKAALDIVDEQELVSISMAVKTTTRYLLNKYANDCPYSESDTTNILYHLNLDFQSTLNQDWMNKNNRQIEYPQVTDMLASCDRLMYCVTNSSVVTKETRDDCRDLVTSVYNMSLTQSYTSNDISTSTIGGELFQNGTIEDSDYDIMVDIQNIWQLLFEWYEPPVELLFYKMPTISGGSDNDGNGWWDGDNELDDDIDEIDRNNPPGTDSNDEEDEEEWDNDNWWGNINVSSGTTDWTERNVDEEIEEFVNVTNNTTRIEKKSSLTQWNNCGTGFTFDTDLFYDKQETYVETWVYINYLTSYIDHIWDNPYEDPIDTVNGEDYLNEDGTVNMEDVQNEISEMLDALADIENMDTESIIENCKSKCQGLPLSDQYVCYSECACGEVSSPPIWPVNEEGEMEPILEAGAFRVKFCAVPSVPTSVQRWKRIYSIEEVFVEMKNILQTLKDSGEQFKHVKTKEYLDSSMMKNDFGEIVSFSINFTKKPLFNSIPWNVKAQERNQRDKNLQQSVLNKVDSCKSELERNKYLVLGNPALDKLEQENHGSMKQYLKDIDAIGKYYNDKISKQKDKADTVSQNIEDRKSVVINEELISFLNYNIDFWTQTEEMFVSLADTAEALRNKIASAE